jgi:type II secretory pathway pseudopilin PulG
MKMFENSEAAYTLVEALVVIFFAALLITASAAAMYQWIPKQAVDGDLSKLASAVAAARSKAILGRSDVTLQVDPAQGRYAILPDPLADTKDMVVVQRLASELRFAWPSGYTPPSSNMNQVFNRKGILKNDFSSKYIYVAHPGKSIYKRLCVSASGNTKVETWKGSTWE